MRSASQRDRPLRGAWVAAAAVALSLCTWPAAAAAQSPPQRSFLVGFNDQLNVPGRPEAAAVTPGGRVYTGWGELAITVGPGREFDPRSHTLDGGRIPIVSMSRVTGGVRYTLTLFAASVRGHPTVFARVGARNLLGRTVRARVSAAATYDGSELTPRARTCCIRTYRYPRARIPPRDGLYFQPGSGFDSDWRYRLAGRGVLLRDGEAVLFYAPPGRARLRQVLRAGGPVGRETEWGRSTYELTLPPGGSRTLDFRMPVSPVVPGSGLFRALARAGFAVHRSQVRSYYRRLFGASVGISLPERKVTDTFYASLANMALPRFVSRGRYVQPVNALRYHAFWLRDGAVMTRAFDLAGLGRIARQNLEYFFTWQQPDGLFISRPEEYDGFGQALWAFGEHYRLTRDRAFARRAMPAVRRAMAWFTAQRRSGGGLMPAVGNPVDNDLVGGHLVGDNFWAAAGVGGAIELARAVGDRGAAAAWAAELSGLKATLRARIAARAPRGPIPPSLERGGGQLWGPLWASYIGDVYPATSPVVRNTLRRARALFSEGIMTYLDRRLLHHYSGFRVFQTELLANQQRNVVGGLYSSLAHTTSTNAGWEAGTSPYSDRIVDDATTPHGWWAAEYVTLLRNMLVREQGRDVYLMSAVSPSWLRPGRTIAVRRAPTALGRVSFALRGTAGGAVLTWSSSLPAGSRLRWPVPYAARSVSAPGLRGRLITLPGRRGRISVRWTLSGEQPSYEATFDRLMRAYARSRNGATRAASEALRRRAAARAVPSDLDRHVTASLARAR
jgi:hypothetical protein